MIVQVSVKIRDDIISKIGLNILHQQKKTVSDDNQNDCASHAH